MNKSRHLLLAALLPVAAAAQAQTQQQLDPVVVTGTREAQPLSRSTADVVLIDADTVRNTTADSIETLLQREAGLQITRTGGPGQSSGFFIRGANTNSAVVLIDGVRVGSATLGQAELESISLSQIDHIEVLRGPASSLYGADAVGGVIQIFTKKGQGPLRVSGNVAVGGYISQQGDLAVSGAQNGFDYALSAGREKSRGVSAVFPNDANGYYNPDKDGYTRNVANVRLGFTPAEGHHIGLNASETKLNAQYDSTEAPTYSDPSPDFRNHLKTKVVALDYQGQLTQLWKTQLQVSNNVDDSNSGGLIMYRYKTDRDQALWQNTLRFSPDQTLVLAYEHLKDKASGDVFGNGISRNNNAYIASYAGAFGAAGVTASVRHDENSAYGGITTGSLGASYAITKEWRVRALVGTTFRAPTYNDLYYPYYGVPTLQPERGRSAEIGTNWQSGGTSAGVTVYRNKVRNLIGYDPDPNGTDCPAGYFGCAGNTSRATLQGTTLTASQRWGNFSVRGTVDFLEARDDTTGKRLNRRAAHQESLAADYDGGVWTVGAALADVGARPDGSANLGGYALVDLRATWRLMPQLRLEAKVLNVGDRRVEPTRDYQGLGRQAWIGLRFDTVGL